MKKIFSLFLFCLLAVTAFAQEGQKAANVVVSTVKEKEIVKTENIIGLVKYDTTTELSSEVSGLVENTTFTEGDIVNKGDVLVRLNTDFLDKDISMKKKEIEVLEVRIENVYRDLQRYEKLYKNNAASEKQYEDLLFEYKRMKKEKQAQELALQRLILEKDKSVIKAPYDGIILSKKVADGAWMAPGNTVCTIAATNDVIVQVPVNEKYVKFFKEGSEIFLNFTAFDKNVTGTAAGLDPIADPKTKNVNLKINIPYFTKLPVNMTANVNLPVSEPQKLRILSRDAVISNKGKNFVYTIKDGKAKILPINIVSYLGEMVGTDTKHIVPGMKVVVEGNSRLRPEQPVKVTGEK